MAPLVIVIRLGDHGRHFCECAPPGLRSARPGQSMLVQRHKGWLLLAEAPEWANRSHRLLTSCPQPGPMRQMTDAHAPMTMSSGLTLKRVAAHAADDMG